MTEPEYDILHPPLEVPEDTDVIGEFIAGERGRYPLAVAPVRIRKGVYTIRLEKGLLDREAVVLDVDHEAGTITVRRGRPDLPSG